MDQWYAWSQLISPATYARNVTDRHLPIMDSFLSAPDVHEAAVRNPRLRGGPFIDCGRDRLEDVRALRDRTRDERADIVALSRALADLNAMLLTEARGYSLQPLYEKVPDLLKGYVELSYDLNDQASYRLLEPLLYRSAFNPANLQSLMLSAIETDERPFVLSTPRLERDDVLHLPLRFADDAIDALFRLKRQPRPFKDILADVPCPAGKEELFRGFLTDVLPAPYRRYQGARARWRYFGHACVLVETPTTSILFDPVLSYDYDHQLPRYTYADLPDVIDYVVITHNHQDHVLFETLVQIKHKVRTVIVPPSSGQLQDPSIKLVMSEIGFQDVVELGELDHVRFPDGEIVALPFFGEHCDLGVRSKTAYLVRIGRRSLLFAADSCNIEHQLYRHIRREFGSIDVLFVGMECVGAPLTWLYGPLLTRKPDRDKDQSRRLNGSDFAQAIQIVHEFGCREVYVYAMGQEPWLNYVMSLKYTEKSRPIVESNRLIEVCRARGIVAERLFGEKEMFLGN